MRFHISLTNMSDGIETTLLTPKEAILYSASLLGKTIDVQGVVVLLDWDRRRIDIAQNGAKLILRLPQEESSLLPKVPDVANIQTDHVLRVRGILRKEQRRTFLQVEKFLPRHSG